MTKTIAGHYDIAILGAGSGGIAAAFEARRRGAIAAILEKHTIGGTHTHSGSIPSQALRSAPSGLTFAQAMERVQTIVERVHAHEQPERFHAAGVDTCVDPHGAAFVDPHTVHIGDYELTADNFIISTGSRPKMLPMGGDYPVPVLHNENFWTERALPEAITFVGGGMVAAELGQALARFGSRVTIIERGERLVGSADVDSSMRLMERFAADGIEVITNAEATSCAATTDGEVLLDIEEGPPGQKTARTLAVSHLFLSMGRVPNTEGLGLENAGVSFTERGITVDDAMRTSAGHIAAIGDVASSANFGHVAHIQGERVARNLLSDTIDPIEVVPVPWILSTEPPIGEVGMTEAEARTVYGTDVEVVRLDPLPARFVVDEAAPGSLKLITNPNGIIVGASVIGPHTSEWLGVLTLAITQGLTPTDLANTAFTNPLRP